MTVTTSGQLAIKLPSDQLQHVSPVGDWCQRTTDDGRAVFTHHERGAIDTSRYEVRAISEKAAAAWITSRHYSGSKGEPGRVWVGLIDKTADLLVGVAIYGVPTSPRTAVNLWGDIPARNVASLTRFCLADSVAANGETWTLARANRIARDAGIDAIVSFADPCLSPDGAAPHGHVGTASRALNMSYSGRSAARRRIVYPARVHVGHGRIRTVMRTAQPRTLQKIRAGESGAAGAITTLVSHGAPKPRPGEDAATWLPRALTALGAVSYTHPGTHRFSLVIGDRRARRRLKLQVDTEPYPEQLDLPRNVRPYSAV